VLATIETRNLRNKQEQSNPTVSHYKALRHKTELEVEFVNLTRTLVSSGLSDLSWAGRTELQNT